MSPFQVGASNLLNPGSATVDNVKIKVFYRIRRCMTGLPGDLTVGGGEEGESPYDHDKVTHVLTLLHARDSLR